MKTMLPVIALSLALLVPVSASAANPVAQYSLTGNSSDSSGNGFNGFDTDVTYVNDPDRGLVASFNGTTSSIDVSSSGYSITERPNYQFAVSFWIKPTARDDYFPGGATDVNPIMGAIGSGVIEIVGQGSWGPMGGSSAYGGIGVNSGGGAGSTAGVETIDIYDGQWHHVVVQWTDPDGVPSDVSLGGGADATVYINNQLALDLNAQTYNGNGAANPSMVLGGPVVWSNGGPANKHYLGLMSDVQLFDDQLTAAEVNELFGGDDPNDPLFGDYNNDDIVDLADYTVWRNNLGEPAMTLPNDPDDTLPIGIEQYNTWRNNFGAQSGAGSINASAVPEPSSLMLLASIAGFGLWTFRR